jgi:hypothetical protein
MRVANSPKTTKPATGGEETGVCNHQTKTAGAIVDSAHGKISRGTWEARMVFFYGRRTAHSSGEAGNDRGAKGLNVNVQL